jgi:ankyrin repeat protein
LASSIAALLAGAAWQTAAATVASAARNANVEEVRKLIAAGSDVNAPEADGSSAVLWAAHQGDPELVALLIKAGADANAANNFGVTPWAIGRWSFWKSPPTTAPPPARCRS